MIRLLLFALLFAVPAAADNVFMDNTTSESNMCVIGITGQTTSNPAAVARATYSPITYTCSPGTYLPADGIECVACPGGKYCEGGQYSYNETTAQGITGDITAGYYSSGGASTATGSTCLSGYSCGNCASSNGANGRPQYSAAGASSCSECPAVTGTLASRVTNYGGYWPNNVHSTITGCNATFSDNDDAATFSIVCYYDTTDNAYGGPHGYCQVYSFKVTACAAGKYKTIESTSEWYAAGGYAHASLGVDFMNGKVCTDTDAGYYSPEGATTQTQCAAGTYQNATGQSSCTACANGYYQDETGQTSCKACPDQTTHVRTTFDTVTYTNNGKSVTITYDGTPSIIRKNADYTLGDKTSVDQCAISESIQTSKGIIYEIDRYNTTTEQYDTLNYLYGWLGAEPGYYLTNKDTDLAGGGCATQGFYAEIQSCPAGSYCPGVTQSSNPPCNSNPTAYWPENKGLNTCPAGSYCPVNSSSATPCDTGYSSNAGASSCTPNTITIDWSGYGAENNQTQQTQCTYGGSITTPTDAPTKRGHVFVGWTFDLGN